MIIKRLIPIIIWILILSLVFSGCTGATPTNSPSTAPITPTTLITTPVAAFTSTTAQPQSLKDILQSKLDIYKLPALAAVVISGGKIIDEGAVGVRKVGDPTPVTIDDQFLIGSCTKAFTATLIGILVEKGQLKWTTTLAEVYPEIAQEMIPKYRDVTLLGLLSHHAGLPSNTGIGRPDPRYSPDTTLPITQQRYEFTKYYLCDNPKANDLPEPGTTFLYSNEGYIIAGAVAEQVTGKSCEELTQTLIFQPLGITSGGFGGSAAGNQIDQPWQHRFDNGVYVPVPVEEPASPTFMGPCGLIQISLKDWAKFVIMHLEGEKGGSPLLKPETFKVLHTPPFLAGRAPGPYGLADYALGWMVSDYYGMTVLIHTGVNADSHGNPINYSLFWTAPEHDFAVLIVTNGGSESAARACNNDVFYSLYTKYLYNK
jgi:CubicO group peptidase (beta-lactamase class C family)